MISESTRDMRLPGAGLARRNASREEHMPREDQAFCAEHVLCVWVEIEGTTSRIRHHAELVAYLVQDRDEDQDEALAVARFIGRCSAGSRHSARNQRQCRPGS